MRRLAGIVCGLALGASGVVMVAVDASSARAAEPTETPAPTPDAPKDPPPTDVDKTARPERGNRGGKGKPVIELEAMVIEGKVAKPQVFYVLGRSRVHYENLKMQRVFVDRILEGAKKNPF